MSETTSEHRLAENEAIFRKINEQVQSGYDETNRLAEEDNQPEFIVSTKSITTPLQFFCECADENCALRVTLTAEEYKNVHENRKRFIIAPGHEVTSVEKVVEKHERYYVVEKNVQPPEDPGVMHPTSIANT